MARRKVQLEEGQIYHIFSRSIAGFTIFRNKLEYQRMKKLLAYYNLVSPPLKFSLFLRMKDREKGCFKYLTKEEELVKIISYCFMPTHIHLVLKNIRTDGISTFMRKILDSYAKYFNIKTKRKGPLWESRFENILVDTDEQLIHLTRYVHLNPTTAYLVNKPQDWEFSSYREFLNEIKQEERICEYLDILDINPENYKDFVNCQIDYQKEFAQMKKLWIE